MKPALPFVTLDHVAIVVPSTEDALRLWRDRLGFPVRHSEVVNDGAVRLTHVGLGNVDLQLVEPLLPDHPLHEHLRKHGASLHHLCFQVDDVDSAAAALRPAGLAGAAPAHQGIQGKRALFLSRTETQGVQLEITGA